MMAKDVEPSSKSKKSESKDKDKYSSSHLINKLKIAITYLQFLVPQHMLSRVAGCLADSKVLWIKRKLIKWFIEYYNVDMSEAEHQTEECYESFNDFFTRPLKSGCRPLPSGETCFVSPADGTISQLGRIENGSIYQAKGHLFSLLELLGGDVKMASLFQGGEFVTIYLSPKDYHRVHMPLTGQLNKMIHVPGRLFSVNDATTELVPGLFAKNERVISIFDTEHGSMAVIMVGAMIVASIDIAWEGVICPKKRNIKYFDYTPGQKYSVKLNQGDEVGKFKLGSTAIVLTQANMIKFLDGYQAQSSIKYAEKLGSINSHAENN